MRVCEDRRDIGLLVPARESLRAMILECFPRAVPMLAYAATTGVFGLLIASCDVEHQDRQLEKPDSIEIDNQIFDTYIVSETILYVPREFRVRDGQPEAINIVTFWPGLMSVPPGDSSESASRVIVMFKPTSRYGPVSDANRLLQRIIERDNLIGTYDTELGLTVYRDKKGKTRMFVPAEYETPTGERYFIRCYEFPNELDDQHECRASYQLTDDLRLQYRFLERLITDWDDVDTAVRQFAQSLTHNPREPKCPLVLTFSK